MINKSKLIIFVLICFILWKILNFLPSLQEHRKFPLLNLFPSLQEDRQFPLVIDDGITLTEASIAPLRVDVYYETLCPDSRSFFIRQLLPAYEKAPELFNIFLVPYGKASTQQEVSGKYLFNCQHGPIECQGNKVHACAVKYVTPSGLLLRYTTCMITDNSDPEEAGRKCAKTLDINWEPVQKCYESEEGDKLLAQHGVSTKQLHPKVSFIPTIRVDEDLRGQPALLKNLFKELCGRFKETPPACT